MKQNFLFYFTAFYLTVYYWTSQVSGEVKKCLESSDCASNECCAHAYYLFRCEKIGYNNGDNCGLCGCENGLTCVAEGINPFRILASRGVCRNRPRPPSPIPIYPIHAAVPPPVVVVNIPEKKPTKPCPDTQTERPVKPVKPGKGSSFHEIFQPIYEQFIEIAVSFAGITLPSDITESTPTLTTP